MMRLVIDDQYFAHGRVPIHVPFSSTIAREFRSKSIPVRGSLIREHDIAAIARGRYCGRSQGRVRCRPAWW